jgi:hypothetical protein
MERSRIPKTNKNMDKHEKIQFAAIWFCAGMLVAQMLMTFTGA